MAEYTSCPPVLPMRRVVQTWWPLAASWLLMALEQPAMSAVVAQLSNPEINLAAWGGVVFPLVLMIESPIIMLLSASTALSKDWDAYAKVRRFMIRAGAALTALHLLVVLTPLYYAIVRILGTPAEVVEPARVGLLLMLPWSWSIAYRRFNQGVLIRFGHARAVAVGTAIRLTVDVSALTIGYLIGTLPGIVVASGTIAMGVIAEAIYAGLRVRPVVRDELKSAAPADEPLTASTFAAFYLPLALTSLLGLVVDPIGSAALGRMPNALESLAAWPVVMGFLFLPRSLGIAYSEVVIALLDEPTAVANLRRFVTILVVAITALLLAVAFTPLAALWFGRVSALSPRLVELATWGLRLALPIPALNALQSWYQGAIMHSRRTRGITEGLAIFLLLASAVMWAGVIWGKADGLYVSQVGFVVGWTANVAWLWVRSRPAMRAIQERCRAAQPA